MLRRGVISRLDGGSIADSNQKYKAREHGQDQEGSLNVSCIQAERRPPLQDTET